MHCKLRNAFARESAWEWWQRPKPQTNTFNAPKTRINLYFIYNDLQNTMIFLADGSKPFSKFDAKSNTMIWIYDRVKSEVCTSEYKPSILAVHFHKQIHRERFCSSYRRFRVLISIQDFENIFHLLFPFEVQLINQIYAFEICEHVQIYFQLLLLLQRKSGVLHWTNAPLTTRLHQNNSINYVISQIDF